MTRVRCLALADSHFSGRPGGKLVECEAIHLEIADEAAADGATLTVHAGDLAHAASTPDERAAEARVLTRLATFGPVVLVRGNHDTRRDLAIFRRLRTVHPILVAEEPTVFVVAGVAVACLPWPDIGDLTTAARAAGGTGTAAEIGRAYRASIAALAAQVEREAGELPRVVVSHAMIQGASFTGEQPRDVRCDLAIGVEDLGVIRADAYVVGHIHRGQAWDLRGTPVIYPGSPYRTDFAELEPKRYLLLDVGDGPAVVTPRATSAAQMLCLEATLDAATGVLQAALAPEHGVERAFMLGDARNADVRVRYRFEPTRREEAKRAYGELRDRLLAAGARSVKPDPVPLVGEKVRGRIVGASGATMTLLDKVCVVAQRQGNVVDGARREDVGALLGELERRTPIA